MIEIFKKDQMIIRTVCDSSWKKGKKDYVPLYIDVHIPHIYNIYNETSIY